MKRNELREQVRKQWERIGAEQYPEVEIMVLNIPDRKAHRREVVCASCSGDGCAFGPTVSLQEYDEKVEYGELTVIEAAKEIAAQLLWGLNETRNHKPSVKLLTSWDWAKERVFITIVSQKEKELLKQVPHIKFLDLAMIYAIDYREVAGVAKVNGYMMKSYGVSIETLHETALQNTKRNNPLKVENIKDVIKELLVAELEESAKMDDDFFQYITAEALAEAIMESGPKSSRESYVVTSRTKTYSSWCLACPDVIEELAERLNSDLIVVPTSIHDVICTAYDSSCTKEQFKKIAYEINHENDDRDRLTDTVYIWKRAGKCLCIW